MLLPEGIARKKEVFDNFSVMHDKSYNNTAEAVQRLATFHHNLRLINAENRKVWQP